MTTSNVLTQYQSEVIEALKSAANLVKPFEKVIIDTLKLFMAIPDKINFLQMGRYGEFTEQTYRNTFTRDDFDWYRELLISMKDRLQAISRLLVADAFFAKQTFILPLLDEGFHVVSRLQGPRSTVFCIFLQVDDPSSY